MAGLIGNQCDKKRRTHAGRSGPVPGRSVKVMLIPSLPAAVRRFHVYTTPGKFPISQLCAARPQHQADSGHSQLWGKARE